MNCKLFFELNKDNKSYCKALQQFPEHQQIAWEAESASAHSPGVVENDEVLYRQVLDPVHFDTVTGKIKPSFFDDASSKGASCHRGQHASLELIRQIALRRVAEANKAPPSSGPRTAIGLATLTVSDVRGIVTSSSPSRRGAGVYDTASVDDDSHADICQLVSGSQEGRSIRAQLFNIAKDNLIPFDGVEFMHPGA